MFGYGGITQKIRVVGMTSPASAKRPNLSLRRKSASRLAAVQCLYRRAVLKDNATPEALIKEYLAHGNDRELVLPAVPHEGLLKEIVHGACEHAAEIEKIIAGSLLPTWKMERISPLLMALLQAAIYELRFHPNSKPGIVIDEYATLAAGFFNEAEVGFVHATLHALAKNAK